MYGVHTGTWMLKDELTYFNLWVRGIVKTEETEQERKQTWGLAGVQGHHGGSHWAGLGGTCQLQLLGRR